MNPLAIGQLNFVPPVEAPFYPAEFREILRIVDFGILGQLTVEYIKGNV
jgi:hypothetical protein